MRLDKYLVDCGIGSRSEVKKLLKAKQITVNDVVETSPKLTINEHNDTVAFRGDILSYETFVYYLLNKPKGVISATEDPKHQTVLDLLDDKARQKGVFPVGRLDRDTHGLLLLTNNGALAHAMLSPKKHVAKTYRAQVSGILTEEDKQAFAQGIALKDFTCQPAELSVLDADEEHQTCVVEVTLSEGKYHQVKRMVASRGKRVTDLQRIRMGTLTLDAQLNLGEWRSLQENELTSLSSYGVDL